MVLENNINQLIEIIVLQFQSPSFAKNSQTDLNYAEISIVTIIGNYC